MFRKQPDDERQGLRGLKYQRVSKRVAAFSNLLNRHQVVLESLPKQAHVLRF